MARESYVHLAVLAATIRGRFVRTAIERPEMLAKRLPPRLPTAEREVVRVIGQR